MQKVNLGRSDLFVSPVCLGSMTWGQQNSIQEAFQQLDYALASGINFIDVAELYPIPPSEETYGDTERFIGEWLAQNPDKRKDVIIATKIAGLGLPWIRNASPISRKTIRQAVEDSLERLKTDYLDLYQLHWPNRTSPHFGKHWPGMVSHTSINTEEQEAQILDILQGLDDCIKAGKIRYFGLSNETPWGISQYIQLSEKHNLPRMISIQNEFNHSTH